MLLKIFRNAAPLLPEHHYGLSGVLSRRYREQVEERHIQYDEAQFQAIGRLQALLDKLLAAQAYENSQDTLKLFVKRPEKCRSLYLYGDVGRGKSMLMDWFFEACPLEQKRRVHFNIFMQEVHAFIHRCREQHKTGVMDALAGHIAAAARLLCFDEFHVTDVADAMILGRLFSKLFELGVVAVITSNRHPKDLYQGGLQREQFLFFVEVLHNEADIVELAAQQDYRLSHFKSLKTTYYFPLDKQAGEFIAHSYRELTSHAEIVPVSLPVMGRTLMLTAAHGDVALATFEELCAQPLGTADYLLLAEAFSTLILSGIPKLSSDKRNEAKRFITLIDVLYEHNVKLLCTAEVDVHELYMKGFGVFEFARTASRLIEMQSERYLGSEHNYRYKSKKRHNIKLSV